MPALLLALPGAAATAMAQDDVAIKTVATPAGASTTEPGDALEAAIVLGCLPALTGMIDLSSQQSADASLLESGFEAVTEPDPLLSMMAPQGSPALFYTRALGKGRLGMALAQDRPFCTLAVSELDNADEATNAVLGHFDHDETPFALTGTRELANGFMKSTDFDWQVSERQTIGARVMEPVRAMPAGKDFVLITMFVSTADDN
ncbi:hypothetical protein GRI38_06740 [Altererythrobacter aurantiacus]|uniref:Uncharacterized protein n=1 Tax=Parapontixanthobacter aurantiacus TaxID=1463599 RepID=A0A844ZFG6_9SPHN|nr:hypothetical protein [Parapontixanthobacter aurantiacus]MXO85727.1 hypothetical protein [Parapontixanthobacter aurantiacus]